MGPSLGEGNEMDSWLWEDCGATSRTLLPGLLAASALTAVSRDSPEALVPELQAGALEALRGHRKASLCHLSYLQGLSLFPGFSETGSALDCAQG